MGMKMIPRHVAGLALLVASVLVAGCNGEEDFSDAVLNSPILGGVNNDPLDPEGLALEVELVAGRDNGSGDPVSAIVANLGYRCGGLSSFVPKSGNAEGFEPYRARCPISARSIEYFIGDDTQLGTSFTLGTATLPVCSGRSANVDPDNNTCDPSAGYFQIALTDLRSAPFRQPGTDPEASYRAAFLSMLDEDVDTTWVIEVPDGAHEATEIATQFPSSLFDTTQYQVGSEAQNYDAFQAAWQNWFDSVEPLSGQTYTYPDLADAEAYASAGANRIRAGLWDFGHNVDVGFGFNYAIAFPEDQAYNTVRLNADVVALPNGNLLGLGLAFGLLEDTRTEFDVLALGSGASVDELLYLGAAPGSDINMEGLFDPGQTSLDFSGRILGVGVYDGLEVSPASGGSAIDFEVDYPALPDFPSNTIDAVDAGNDLGRFEGTVFGDVLGSVGFQAQRSGVISGYLDQRAMDLLPPFYQLTLNQACFGSECNDFPFSEAGISYPTAIDGELVTGERPREDLFGDAGQVHLQFLDSGYIVTDVDRDCSPVDPVDLTDANNGTQEYMVGFVSRTEYVEAASTVASANILVFLVGDAALSGGADQAVPNPPYIPQFGTLISGRINLEDADQGKPIYRLSEERYAARIRAAWTDNYQPIKYGFDRDNNLSDAEAIEQFTLFSGAIDGLALAEDPDNLGTCIEEEDLPPPAP